MPLNLLDLKNFSWQYELEDMPRGEHRYLGVTIVFYDFLAGQKGCRSRKGPNYFSLPKNTRHEICCPSNKI